MRRCFFQVTTGQEMLPSFTSFYIFPQLTRTGKYIWAGCWHLVICRVLKQSPGALKQDNWTQTVIPGCTSMHPTMKFALQKRILAASVQEEAFQLRLSQGFANGDLKDRMASLERLWAKRAELLWNTVCFLEGKQKQNKTNFWVCLIPADSTWLEK